MKDPQMQKLVSKRSNPHMTKSEVPKPGENISKSKCLADLAAVGIHLVAEVVLEEWEVWKMFFPKCSEEALQVHSKEGLVWDKDLSRKEVTMQPAGLI